MSFDDALEYVLRDERSRQVPILFIVQTLIICEDNHLFKEDEDVRKLYATTKPNKLGARHRGRKSLSAYSVNKHCADGQ